MKNEQDVRDQIVEAATSLFRKWGLKKTTMEDIAAEAGKGKATLYYYFPKKEDIFMTVVQQQFAEMQVIIDKELDVLEGAADKLKRYLLVVFQEARKRITVFDILKMEIREDRKLFDQLREQFDIADMQVIEKIIKYGIKRGEFIECKEEEILTISYGISSVTRSLIINLLIEQDLPGEGKRIAVLSDYLVRGLRV